MGEDWRTAELSLLDAALCAYAEKLTLAPAEMRRADIDALRAHGLDDAAVHDAIQVVSFFNYINRVADAVHVDPEPGMPPYPGEEAPPASAGPESARASRPGEGGEARSGSAER